MKKNNYTSLHKRKLSAAAAFTLIEVLVVIALTVVLLTVLFLPLIQAFNFTGQAQAIAQAQDAARLTTEQLTLELSSAATVRDTTNYFLDLPLQNKSGNQILAHAYNAYIDIVPPKVQAGTIIDPTIDRNNPTQTVGASAGITGVNPELSGADIALPLSAGSTVIRYFIGLRYPIDPNYVPAAVIGDTDGTSADSVADSTFAKPGDPQPYSNRYDGVDISASDAHYSSYVAQQGLNNTYQLYRVAFQPYAPTGSGPTATYSVNKNLLDVTSSGAPIMDDPDFFRVVLAGERNLAQDSTGATLYTATTAKVHNDRVYNWYKIAKEVIATRDIDLVGLTRTGSKIVYDAHGNPVDSYEVTSGGTTPNYSEPIVRTTVNFAPGLISNDSMAASTTSDQSQGYGESPSSNVSSLPYVPTLFEAQYGNWQGTPAVTITKSGVGATVTTLQSRLYTSADQTAGYTYLGSPNYSGNTTITPGTDLILANVTSGSPGTPVYDITAGAPIWNSATLPSPAPVYDALLLDTSRGEVNFSLPALPTYTGSGAAPVPANTYFQVTGPFNLYDGQSATNVLYLGDYGLLDGTPLPAPATEATSGVPNSASPVQNATLVVNSERVVGPDLASGIVGSAPTADLVQYTRVPSSPTLPDQYSVDYQNATITFAPDHVPTTVQVAFDYQNNLSTSTTTDTTDTLQASYYTAAIMRLNLGIRVYSSATSASQYFSLNSQVGVGNAKAN